MALYLRWLAKYESEDAEGPPLGIILCAGASTRQIELLELGSADIHVAEYLAVLPPRDVLERKLKDAIGAARLRFEGRELENLRVRQPGLRSSPSPTLRFRSTLACSG
jgi:hypothetical protein